MQFYDVFKHILALECSFTTGFCRFGVPRTFPPDQTNSEIWVRGGGTMGGGATRIGGLMELWRNFMAAGCGLMAWWLMAWRIDG